MIEFLASELFRNAMLNLFELISVFVVLGALILVFILIIFMVKNLILKK